MPTNDCELIGAGFLGQPVNTITAFAFVVAGLLVARRPRVRWVGLALTATGLGSILFHGPMPAGSTWAHDVSLTWLILVVAGLGQAWERWTRLPALVGIGVLMAVLPDAAVPVAVFFTVSVLLLHLRPPRKPQTVTAFSLIGLAAVFGRLGATDGPLCDPTSILQPHGIWHIGAASVIAWWAMSIGLPQAETARRRSA